jgi:hypothetical protein
MILDRKQFDDFDDFADFEDKLDPTLDPDSGMSRANSSLGWRRIIIERAVTNVRKAMETKSDLKSSHKLGSLIFDDEANRFGRVIESRPGFLNVALLTGGKLVKQDLNRLDFIRKNRQKLTLPQMAKELFLSEVEVISLLNQIELESEKLRIQPAAQPAAIVTAKKSPVVVKQPSNKPIKVHKKPDVKAFLPSETHKKVPAKNNNNKATIKIAAKSTKAPPLKSKKPNTNAKIKPPTYSKLLPKGITTDPVVDPNCYIKQNFLLMSNKELAGATGLSEHTVRRKLGEWGLKRKDFSNS